LVCVKYAVECHILFSALYAVWAFSMRAVMSASVPPVLSGMLSRYANCVTLSVVSLHMRRVSLLAVLTAHHKSNVASDGTSCNNVGFSTGLYLCPELLPTRKQVFLLNRRFAVYFRSNFLIKLPVPSSVSFHFLSCRDCQPHLLHVRNSDITGGHVCHGGSPSLA